MLRQAFVAWGVVVHAGRELKLVVVCAPGRLACLSVRSVFQVRLAAAPAFALCIREGQQSAYPVLGRIATWVADAGACTTVRKAWTWRPADNTCTCRCHMRGAAVQVWCQLALVECSHGNKAEQAGSQMIPEQVPPAVPSLQPAPSDTGPTSAPLQPRLLASAAACPEARSTALMQLQDGHGEGSGSNNAKVPCVMDTDELKNALQQLHAQQQGCITVSDSSNGLRRAAEDWASGSLAGAEQCGACQSTVPAGPGQEDLESFRVKRDQSQWVQEDDAHCLGRCKSSIAKGATHTDDVGCGVAGLHGGDGDSFPAVAEVHTATLCGNPSGMHSNGSRGKGELRHLSGSGRQRQERGRGTALPAADCIASGSSLAEAQAALGLPSRDLSTFASAQERLESMQVTQDALVATMQREGTLRRGLDTENEPKMEAVAAERRQSAERAQEAMQRQTAALHKQVCPSPSC